MERIYLPHHSMWNYSTEMGVATKATDKNVSGVICALKNTYMIISALETNIHKPQF